METTITITRDTRARLARLQAAMKPEKGGRAVTADEAINRALDRSDELQRLIDQDRVVYSENARVTYAHRETT